MELMNSYERRGLKKGLQEGRVEGKQDSICTILEARFGSSSASAQEKVRAIHDLSRLDDVLKQIFAAESLEDAQVAIEKVAQS